eukprot:g794.t2
MSDVQVSNSKHSDPQWIKTKRVAVAAEAQAEDAAVEIPNFPKTEAQIKIIEEAINGNVLFDTLSIPAKSAIVDSMVQLTASVGTTIIKEGDTVATKFYVLEDGCCDVFKKDSNSESKKVHSYGPGSGFGELALLYNAPRAATVKAMTTCRLWVMERSVYVSVKHSFDKKMIEERRRLVENVPLLQMLSEDHKNILADALELVDFERSTIISEGEVGDRFYLIKDGRVNVKKGETTVDKLKEGDYFGERALIQDDLRAATVIADGYVACYTLSRDSFNQLLGPIETLWRFEVLKKVPVFFSLNEKQLWQLSESLESQHFSKGELVLKKGDPGDTFYIIEEGTFSIFDDKKIELARVGKGSCFGELALLKQDVRAANVVAMTDAKCLTLHRDAFNAMLGSLQQIQHLWRFEALRRVPILSQLTSAQRSTLCSAFIQERSKVGQDVIKQGEQGDRFYIVESGIVGVFKDGSSKPLTKLGPTCYFGELALLKNEKRAATVTALTEVTVLSLDRGAFDELLGPLQEILQKQASAYEASSGEIPASKLALKDLKEEGILGTGGFGRVLLVSYDSKYYALKCMSKAYVMESGLQDHVLREREIMKELESPFIVALKSTFKDKHNIYMLMESVMGGELFTYLQTRKKALSESHARFYAASVICAFEYMHDRQIVYRDLKPENLLIDEKGYVKITDFGFAKRMLLGGKTYTLCGTPEYLAPELVTQTGHTFTADWWALGVLLYELATGQPPFYDEDRVKMFKKICDVRYSFPVNMSQDMRDLIRRLLVRRPAMRLGAEKKGASSIKTHPWFSNFNWEEFESRKMTPPYIPKVKGPGDLSNFIPPPDAHTHPAAQRSRSVIAMKMKTFLSLVLLWSILSIVLGKTDLVLTSVRREIHLLNSYAEIATLFNFRLTKDTINPEFVVCLRRKQFKREAFFQAHLGSDAKGRKLEVGPVTGELESQVPDGLICKGIKLPENKKEADSEEIAIYTSGVYIDVLNPMPEEIKQHEVQKMLYRDTLVAMVPYPAEVQFTTVILPSEEILSNTMAEPHKKDGKMLSYGPFSNVEPFNAQPLSVHFVHNNQFIIIQKAVKEVQVSLWGNIYVNENYEIVNAGARLKGSWSRLDYQKQKGASPAVIEEFRAEIPRHSDMFYYTDDIGNISTSKIVHIINQGRIAALKPRYPLFGGWKTKFNFGYSTDIVGYLWNRPGSSNELHLQFSPSIHYPLIRDYELRIVLPDGSSDINYEQLPFEVDVSYDTKYWYFDVVGRQVLVLKKQNVLDRHQTSFKVKYSPSILAPYRKPILFFVIYFGLFSAYMIYLRLDFEIVGNNEENKAKIQALLSQLKIVFKERQYKFETFMSIISEMKSGQSSKKSSSNKSKFQSEIKETHKKVLEFKVSLKRLDYNRLYEVEDLIAKDNEVEVCFHVLLSELDMIMV